MNYLGYAEMNLKYFAGKITRRENFNIVKFGDGEYNCMRGTQGENTDNHLYSKELGDKLIYSFIALSHKRNVRFPDWFYSNPNDYINEGYIEELILSKNLTVNWLKPFELLMASERYLQSNCLYEFYREIKDSNRTKIYIGNKKHEPLLGLLKLDRMFFIPPVNAFEKYQELLQQFYYDGKTDFIDDCIVMLSVGMMSPILANDLLTINPSITVLDIGSGFDSFLGKKTRNYQMEHEACVNYFQIL
jgi:hypothetical protein